MVLPRLSHMSSRSILLITRFDFMMNIIVNLYLPSQIPLPVSTLGRGPVELGTVRSHIQLCTITSVERWHSNLLIIRYRVAYHSFYIILISRTIHLASRNDPSNLILLLYDFIRIIDDPRTNTQEVVEMTRNTQD